MHAGLWTVLCAGALAGLAACDGAASDPGRDQPLQVAHATLHDGQLPPPPANAGAGDSAVALQVTSVELPSGHVGPGEQRVVTGRTSSDAYAVALQLADRGSGYWVLPVDGLDPQTPGERTWSASAALGYGVPPGPTKLRLAAVGSSGKLGDTREISLCVTPDFPDNLNSCDPSRPPPDQVVQLAWDRDADVDLEVVRPDGSVVSAKKGGTADTGQLDVDAGANCGDDALRRENAVWTGSAPKGRYVARARLIHACGQPAVRMKLRVLRKTSVAGGFAADTVLSVQGEFLGAQADPAGAPLTLAAWDVN